ncbi:DNA-binding response regulator [Salinicola endophyticus]|uniref:DNA-binding response regulator n=1 Tax=Salinicola endophyticus TaxID=1949083 RepID=A0ABY8FGJ5_9GAMM|nr:MULTISPECIES: LuxR C-terminal-related transcriptional regulator [Salinicola]WFF40296.1 DNA-binding response regulator [Salinicola endophyticus]
MSNPEASMLIVTSETAQSTLLAMSLSSHTGMSYRLAGPQEPHKVSGASFDIVLIDLSQVDPILFQKWEESLADQGDGEVQICAFNAKNDTHALDAVSLSHIRGVFFQQDTPELMAKGLKQILQGQIWLSRNLMSLLIDKLRRQSVDAYRMEGYLTHRERQVVGLVGLGATNAQIAEKLFLSEHTVKTHIYNIFKKIGAQNRVQVVCWARDHLGALPNLSRPRTKH